MTEGTRTSILLSKESKERLTVLCKHFDVSQTALFEIVMSMTIEEATPFVQRGKDLIWKERLKCRKDKLEIRKIIAKLSPEELIKIANEIKAKNGK